MKQINTHFVITIEFSYVTYPCLPNVYGKTVKGLEGNSQVLLPWSGYSIHRTFLRLRNCNSH